MGQFESNRVWLNRRISEEAGLFKLTSLLPVDRTGSTCLRRANASQLPGVY